MKRISTILAGAALLFAMVSCDKVNGPYKKDVVVEGNRVVLLEDYTGVRCVNCPEGAEIAHELEEAFPDNLVVLSVHAGFLADPMNPVTGYPDFRTESGTAWYNTFGFMSNPIGTVNRTKTAGSYGYQKEGWATAVAAEIAKEQTASVEIENSYNEASRKLDVTVKAKFLEEQTGVTYVFACVMEDSVVGRQLMPEGANDNYVHRHMMRAAINGTWGEELCSGAEEDEEFEKKMSITLDDAFNADQCYVIAYIYDDATKEIIQAAEKKIK